jgi:hypothetical protein
MSTTLTNQAFANLLEGIAPGLSKLPLLALDDVMCLWKAEDFQTEHPPVIHPARGVWSYRGYEEEYILPILPNILRAKIVEFICEDHMYWNRSHFFKRMLGATQPSLFRVSYMVNNQPIEVEACFPTLGPEIKNIRGRYMYHTMREPYGAFTVVPGGGYILAHSPDGGIAVFGRLLNHYFGGEPFDDSLWEVVTEKPDGDLRFLPKMMTRYDFIYPYFGLSEATQHALANLDVHGERITFYTKYVQKPPMMWESYRELLVEDCVPCDILNRIPELMQNMLCNLGRKVQIGWNQYTSKYRLTGPTGFGIDLVLETLRGEPPAKRRRTDVEEPSALREIAPGYYAENQLFQGTRPGPKYFTRKDTFVNQYEHCFSRENRVWTGRVYFARTWLYEYSINKALGYIKEGRMHLKRIVNTRFAPESHMNRCREPTPLFELFMV